LTPVAHPQRLVAPATSGNEVPVAHPTALVAPQKTPEGTLTPPTKSGKYTIVVRKDGQPDVRNPDQLQSGDRILGHADTRNNADLQKDAFTSKYSNADLWAMSGDANDDAKAQVAASPVSNATAIATNTKHLEHVNTNTFKNRDNIAVNTKSISGNRSLIADNSSRIDENSDAIASNKSEIKGLRQDLERQAKVMDGAMAQGIATSSLVMPYNVGKISTTVALGHSGSADAIAGGVGVRFTKNFTARSNIAYDTGSENVSIGAGVGYEW
ncbi:YadA C-terminal domain-containing protein, partial [Vibrio inusitatus]